MRMTISQLEECERLLGTTCRLQFNEPPTNYELALKQLNALYRQLKYAVDNTPKYNHIAIVICVSQVNGELVSVVYEKTGGRPKKHLSQTGKQLKANNRKHTFICIAILQEKTVFPLRTKYAVSKIKKQKDKAEISQL